MYTAAAWADANNEQLISANAEDELPQAVHVPKVERWATHLAESMETSIQPICVVLEGLGSVATDIVSALRLAGAQSMQLICSVALPSLVESLPSLGQPKVLVFGDYFTSTNVVKVSRHTVWEAATLYAKQHKSMDTFQSMLETVATLWCSTGKAPLFGTDRLGLRLPVFNSKATIVLPISINYTEWALAGLEYPQPDIHKLFVDGATHGCLIGCALRSWAAYSGAAVGVIMQRAQRWMAQMHAGFGAFSGAWTRAMWQASLMLRKLGVDGHLGGVLVTATPRFTSVAEVSTWWGKHDTAYQWSEVVPCLGVVPDHCAFSGFVDPLVAKVMPIVQRWYRATNIAHGGSVALAMQRILHVADIECAVAITAAADGSRTLTPYPLRLGFDGRVSDWLFFPTFEKDGARAELLFRLTSPAAAVQLVHGLPGMLQRTHYIADVAEQGNFDTWEGSDGGDGGDFGDDNAPPPPPGGPEEGQEPGDKHSHLIAPGPEMHDDELEETTEHLLEQAHPGASRQSGATTTVAPAPVLVAGVPKPPSVPKPTPPPRVMEMQPAKHVELQPRAATIKPPRDAPRHVTLALLNAQEGPLSTSTDGRLFVEQMAAAMGCTGPGLSGKSASSLSSIAATTSVPRLLSTLPQAARARAANEAYSLFACARHYMQAGEWQDLAYAATRAKNVAKAMADSPSVTLEELTSEIGADRVAMQPNGHVAAFAALEAGEVAARGFPILVTKKGKDKRRQEWVSARNTSEADILKQGKELLATWEAALQGGSGRSDPGKASFSSAVSIGPAAATTTTIVRRTFAEVTATAPVDPTVKPPLSSIAETPAPDLLVSDPPGLPEGVDATTVAAAASLEAAKMGSDADFDEGSVHTPLQHGVQPLDAVEGARGIVENPMLKPQAPGKKPSVASKVVSAVVESLPFGRPGN